jgi:Xaa-Pro aminopeptidase
MIEYGDTVHFMIETNGPSGLYSETMRTTCVGKAPSELLEQYELVLEAQKVTRDLLKPGAYPEEIYEANNAFMKKHGYPEERRIYSHGQGYDLVERPSMNPGEKMKIKAGMNIAIHPTVASAKASAQVCDNYIVQEKGEPLRLHTAAHKIYIV